ncbi:MAG: tetratricopeptide repeat protein [Chloroflexota bacterium]
MAKITLRTYIREIETLIERGNTDEAVVHCRHILKTFPKFLDAYRMLGKAYLESQRYTEAADVFKRILTAAPEDFVSHVGLSIINDEQKKLDDTIWHMERAFETQPSNAAVQSELQRLYGRRDGMEPHKIRLTRGALAHMYVQGELYPQAIGEIRSVLNEDPNRTDMQALLALAYFRNGQKVEATETCSQLLGRYPYCLAANRILVEILPGTGMADNVPTYRGRVVELDPYAAYSPGSIFQSDEASDNAITIDRFDYKGQPAGPQPEWKEGLTLPAATPAPAPSQTGWLRASTPPQPGAPAPAPAQPDWLREAAPLEAAAPAPAPGETLPDFLRDAGWGASTGAFDESAQTFEEAAPSTGAGEIEKAELPDWVKAMAPTSEPEPAPSESQEDWLSKLGGEPPQEPASVPAGETPDWLSSLGEPAHPPAQAAGETPDWLSSLGEAQPAPAPAPQETPDWFASPVESAGPPAVPNAASDMPDWLTSMDETPAAQPSAAADASDWLASLAREEAGAVSEAQLSEPAPSWMGESEPVEEAPMRDSSVEPEKPEPPAAGMGPSIGDLGASAADQDAAMLWLESLAAKQGAKAEELITNPDERLEKPPEWVEQARIAGETQVAEPAPAEEAAAPEEFAAPPETAWAEPEEPSAFGMAAEVDQTSAWLRDLEAKEEEAKEPAWSGEIEVTPPATAPMAEPAAEADLPSWLRGLDQEPPRKPATDELPGWLKEEESKEEPLPEPTRPTDWIPETPKAAGPAIPEPPRVAEPPKVSAPAPAVPVAPPAPKTLMPAAAIAREEEPVPSPKPPKPAPRKKAELPAADRAKLKRPDMLPPLVDPVLAGARDHIEHARIPDALQGYAALIRKGKFLEEVTFDLKEALYRFPVEVSIWQALGDVYMRANRLQDALDAYTKAEELLR